MLKEIRIAGFGGQGVILATHILGRAASVHEGRFATMTQSYGPEARGGAASAALIVSDEPVLFPYVTRPDILVVMSQEAYTRFTPEVKPGGILLVEEDLVKLDHLAQGLKIYGIPATRLAEELGRKMVLNVIMTGFLCAVTAAVSAEAARKAVEEAVPARFRDLNLQAFDKGFLYGQELLKRGPQIVNENEELVLESEA
jgi:2-oxoglutarate ferredoxin oxidoreductase subunit gamma